MCRSLIAAIVLNLATVSAQGLDRVTFERDSRSQSISGKIVSKAVDGGLLVQDREGILWAVQPEELVRQWRDDVPYQAMQRDELQEQLQQQLPGFRFHPTAHYLVCYNTSPAYAEWCGSLYERLYLAFRNFWKRRGLELTDPDYPLVALVFDRQDSYEKYAKTELGLAAGSVIGYYSLRSNRVAMYDLTGNGGLQQTGGRLGSTAQINRLLRNPRAERLVATIVHEATHQLAYNCGMHARYADIPVWVSEGLAVYFETPDLSSSRGWRTIGGINRVRLQGFRQYLPNRPDDSLVLLLTDDQRFRNAETTQEAYSEAWAWNYFLINRHLDQYVGYLQKLSQKPPIVYDTAEERFAEFTEVFGDDLDELDVEFLRFMATLR